jgi:hypothetical protein
MAENSKKADILNKIKEIKELFIEDINSFHNSISKNNESPESLKKEMEDEIESCLKAYIGNLLKLAKNTKPGIPEVYVDKNKEILLSDILENDSKINEASVELRKALLESTSKITDKVDSIFSYNLDAIRERVSIAGALESQLEDYMRRFSKNKDRTEELGWYYAFKLLISRKNVNALDSIKEAMEKLHSKKNINDGEYFHLLMKESINSYQSKMGTPKVFEETSPEIEKGRKADAKKGKKKYYKPDEEEQKLGFRKYTTAGGGLTDIWFVEEKNNKSFRVITAAANYYFDNDMEGTQLPRHNFKIAMALSVYKNLNKPATADGFSKWFYDKQKDLVKIQIKETESAIKEYLEYENSPNVPESKDITNLTNILKVLDPEEKTDILKLLSEKGVRSQLKRDSLNVNIFQIFTNYFKGYEDDKFDNFEYNLASDSRGSNVDIAQKKEDFYSFSRWLVWEASESNNALPMKSLSDNYTVLSNGANQLSSREMRKSLRNRVSEVSSGTAEEFMKSIDNSQDMISVIMSRMLKTSNKEGLIEAVLTTILVELKELEPYKGQPELWSEFADDLIKINTGYVLSENAKKYPGLMKTALEVEGRAKLETNKTRERNNLPEIADEFGLRENNNFFEKTGRKWAAKEGKEVEVISYLFGKIKPEEKEALSEYLNEEKDGAPIFYKSYLIVSQIEDATSLKEINSLILSNKEECNKNQRVIGEIIISKTIEKGESQKKPASPEKLEYLNLLLERVLFTKDDDVITKIVDYVLDGGLRKNLPEIKAEFGENLEKIEEAKPKTKKTSISLSKRQSKGINQ